MNQNEAKPESIYDLWIRCRANQTRGISAITDLIGAPEVEIVGVLSQKIKPTLLEIDTAPYVLSLHPDTGAVEVYAGKHIALPVTEGCIDVRHLSTRTCIQIAALFPSIDTICADIRRKQVELKPPLPSEIVGYCSITNLCDMLPCNTVQRLYAAVMGVQYGGLSSSSDMVVSVASECARQLRNHLIHERVTKIDVKKDYIGNMSEIIIENIMIIDVDEIKRTFQY